MAEKVKKMQAICVKCGTTASFTQRHTIEDTSQKDTIVIVGGQEMYRPVCRVCYLDVKSDTESDRLSIGETKQNGISIAQSPSTSTIVESRPTLTQNLGKKRLAMQVDSMLPVEKLQEKIEKEAGKNSKKNAIKKQISASAQINSGLTKRTSTGA